MKNKNGLKRLLMISSAFLLLIGGGYVSAMIFGKKVVYEGEGKAVCGMLRLRNQIKRQSGLIIF